MKKSLKINRRVNRKSVIIIGILFFANLMFASANNAEVKIDEGRTLKPKEVELKLENWMLNVDLFQKMINIGEAFFVEESEIELEPWMLNPSFFEVKMQNISVNNDFQNNEIEEAIELEPWMLDVNKF